MVTAFLWGDNPRRSESNQWHRVTCSIINKLLQTVWSNIGNSRGNRSVLSRSVRRFGSSCTCVSVLCLAFGQVLWASWVLNTYFDLKGSNTKSMSELMIWTDIDKKRAWSSCLGGMFGISLTILESRPFHLLDLTWLSRIHLTRYDSEDVAHERNRGCGNLGRIHRYRDPSMERLAVSSSYNSENLVRPQDNLSYRLRLLSHANGPISQSRISRLTLTKKKRNA